jgi:hypothetical protein
MKKPVYQHLSSLLNARDNCAAMLKRNAQDTNSANWFDRHEATAERLVKSFMPSGSGIDCGTKLLWDESTSEKLVFAFSYHHMNENGMYDGWTEHKAIVTPSLQFGYSLKITGRDRNQIKEYLNETYSLALDTVAEMDSEGNWVEEKE